MSTGNEHQRTARPAAAFPAARGLYDIRRWTVMPRGGPFAPAGEPELAARDITAFYVTLHH